MFAIIYLLGTFVADLLKSRRRLEIENLFLRHQLNIVLRRSPQRLRLRSSDRALLGCMTRVWPSLLGLARVVQPDTIVRWHRARFRAYWRWKSQGWAGRPRIEHELRDLIRRMCKENPLWGAPRIHGELLKLGFEIAESTVSTYMIRRSPLESYLLTITSSARAARAEGGRIASQAPLVLGHRPLAALFFRSAAHMSLAWPRSELTAGQR